MSSVMRSVIGTLAVLFSIQSLATWAIRTAKSSPSAADEKQTTAAAHELSFHERYKVATPTCDGPGRGGDRGSRKG